ncbi:MAG: hypothetical protein NUV97_01960 [archaeon]|nr:hypothetical protein [archaeon]MCR4323717.1 hypothetical protein [Nanoarchaeota archaeon]
MIEYLILLIAVPLGFLFASVTKGEKEIYSKVPYFPVMIWLLLVGAIIFFTLDKAIFMTFAFMFITTLVWWKG